MGTKFTGIEDNNAYVEWCNTHPTGYVYNVSKDTLHRASCRYVSHHSSIDMTKPPTHKTATGSNAKICYATRDELLADLEGQDINHCGTCDP